ncbi:histidine phosphatase superfamily [Ochromonadaceae sp. CCMP2298]|nr:histidine phosphatase superfamily [Ochromonadaceae sp. CCMP2298]
MASTASTSAPPPRDKRIIFIRHGTTEMNERMKEVPWFSPKFVDAGLWDTRLSEKGAAQAKEVHQCLIDSGESTYKLSTVEALIASPLTRTLQTAELIFGQLLPGIPRISQPLLRERVYLSSEVGRPKSVLEREYPQWDLSALPDTPCVDSVDAYVEWRPPGLYCVEGEPLSVFVHRMRELKAWLGQRPEDCIAVVAHWGVIKALTGYEAGNCEIVERTLAQLSEEPVVDPY